MVEDEWRPGQGTFLSGDLLAVEPRRQGTVDGQKLPVSGKGGAARLPANEGGKDEGEVRR